MYFLRNLFCVKVKLLISFPDWEVRGTKADPLCDRGVSPGAQRSRQTLGIRPRAGERETTLPIPLLRNLINAVGPTSTRIGSVVAGSRADPTPMTCQPPAASPQPALPTAMPTTRIRFTRIWKKSVDKYNGASCRGYMDYRRPGPPCF
ncbi:hypothetical protein TNIN_208131 [Trichonephila inaurata madagascariensis]|uniref:Uncharacterized protein n=1 Tax=Trichonephila inaurata madagascariensis TaxID=2747483 RepID=A0A8X7C195_9ARAC|nr:hypothetical protein TNIN_208131 [Trichonephila inaurata madagascariensis]